MDLFFKGIINLDYVKIIANYLPQFHEIAENNKWWGEGFTDWLAVKKASPLYEGHKQPRIPMDNHYYHLDDVDEIRWQAQLAKKYGVYGFGIYHYWFSSNLKLLEKPAELIRDNPDIDIHYMFIWDNTSWIRTWKNIRHGNAWAPNYDENADGNDDGILAELKYGNMDDWHRHFLYLLPFFQDNRYIKIGNKPIFSVFKPDNNNEIIKEIMKYWNNLALEYGFDGIVCITKENWKYKDNEYQMKYAPFNINSIWKGLKNKIGYLFAKKINRINFYDYDKLWNDILLDAKISNEKTFLSGFVDYDDSPRRGHSAKIVRGSTPSKFGRYMKKLLNISLQQNKEYVFVTAWNEWGEGAYLEPDETNGYAYLEALKAAVDEVNTKEK